MPAAVPPRSKRFKKLGVGMLARLGARLYLAYMWLVTRTSRLDRGRTDELVAVAQSGRAITLAMLHQDVVAAPYLFRGLGIITLASRGDAGEMISSMLERCGFSIVRGGSSRRSRSRHSPTAAFRELLERSLAPGDRAAIVAITPDGSYGPAGAVKAGVAMLAHMIHGDVYCMKIHARRAIYLDTWDRTMVPLPFGRIDILYDGPIPAPASTARADVETCRREIEERLHELHRRAFDDDGRQPIPRLERFAPSETAGAG